MHLLVLLYVDDMIITGDNESKISNLRSELSVCFEIKNLGEIGLFSWFGSGTIRSRAFCFSNKLCKESFGMFWHERVKGEGYSNRAKSQVEER